MAEKFLSVAPYADDMAYLQDELRWLEVRAFRIRSQQALERASAGRSAARQAWQDREPAPSAATLRRDIERARGEEDRLRQHIDACRQAGLEIDRETGLDRICRLHDLTEIDRIVLLAAVSPILDRRFEDLLGSLSRHGEGSNITIEAALALADLDMVARLEAYRRFSPRAPLVAHDLIVSRFGKANTPRDLVDVDLDLPSRTFELLIGRHGLAAEFAEFSALEAPRATFAQVVLSATDKARILNVVDSRALVDEARRKWGLDDIITYGRGTLLLFHGAPGTGKTLTAHAVAEHMGMRLLNVDLPTFMANQQAGHFLPGLFREARLQNAVLFFDECETLFATRARGNALMTMLLTEIERFEGVAILATNMPEQLDAALDRRVLVRVEFPPPDRESRREIWRRHLPATVPLAKDVDLDALADRFDLAGGYIKNAVLTATAEAVRTGGKRPRVTMAHLVDAAHAQSARPTGDPDAPHATLPKARLSDVMVPADLRAQLSEVVDAARNRRTVLEKWGIGAHLSHGKGIAALLSGQPGTGKTLCAEAIAGELCRPLLTVSAADMLSKWIGESEQNIARVFVQASRLGAVLFLDEIDALLPARSGAGGPAARHDVSMINTLLTAIERHEGLVLLATNLPDTLDPALSRRLAYRLEFPLPDATVRARIWQRLLPATVPVAAPLDFEALGRAHALTGGLIKNAVFKAAFRAARDDRPLTQADLDRAADDESPTRRAPRAPTAHPPAAH